MLGLCWGAFAFFTTLTTARDTSPAALKAKHAKAFEKQARALRRNGEFEKRAPGANIKNITFSNPKASGALPCHSSLMFTETEEVVV